MNRKYLRKFQFPLLIALGTWPVSAVGMGLIREDFLPFGWIFPLAFLTLACIAILVPGKWRLAFCIAGTALLVGAGAAFDQWKVLVISLAYSGMLLWSLEIGGWPREREIPPCWIYVGLAVHVAAQIVLMYVRNNGRADLDVTAPGILVSFLGFVLLVMLSLNRRTLEAASMGRHRPSRAMRRKNVILILAVILVAVVAAMSPAAGMAISSLLAQVRRLAQWFGGFFGGDDQISESTEATEETRPPEQTGQASQLALVLWDIASIIAQAAVIVMLVFVAFRILRWLWKRLGWLMESMNRYAANVAEDYEDEITDTREDEDHETGLGRRGRKKTRDYGAALTPALRIRREYLRLWREHHRWGDASTARENLPEDMAVLYERARYSDHPVTDEEAAYFRRESKEL